MSCGAGVREKKKFSGVRDAANKRKQGSEIAELGRERLESQLSVAESVLGDDRGFTRRRYRET